MPMVNDENGCMGHFGPRVCHMLRKRLDVGNDEVQPVAQRSACLIQCARSTVVYGSLCALVGQDLGPHGLT